MTLHVPDVAWVISAPFAVKVQVNLNIVAGAAVVVVVVVVVTLPPLPPLAAAFKAANLWAAATEASYWEDKELNTPPVTNPKPRFLSKVVSLEKVVFTIVTSKIPVRMETNPKAWMAKAGPIRAKNCPKVCMAFPSIGYCLAVKSKRSVRSIFTNTSETFFFIVPTCIPYQILAYLEL